MMDSLYDVLGVGRDADDDEIIAAHRRAAKASHPDRGGDRDQFEAVTRAALVLRNPAKRARYDRDGTIDDQPDVSESAIANLLVGAFDKAMESVNGQFEHVDIIAVMKKGLRAQLTEAGQQTAHLETVVARVAKAKARLRFKGEQPNPIAGMLDQRVAEAKRAIAATEEQIGYLKLALERAGSYYWQVDPKPQVVMQQGFFTSTTSTGYGR